jgi:hypothetical protein
MNTLVFYDEDLIIALKGLIVQALNKSGSE